MQQEKDSSALIPIVTTSVIQGFEIKEVKGMVWASSVRAKSFLQDLKALFRVFLGGEVKEYTSLLNDTRRDILLRLNTNAKKMGANAVVDVDMVSTQVVPGTVEILAYGTAVVVEETKKK